MAATTDEITRLLTAWREGQPEAAENLLAAVYGELKAIARHYVVRHQPDVSFQPTELVHEAYLRLADKGDSDWKNRSYFYAFAAKVMRNLLVDHLRAKQYAKRGAGAEQVDLEEAPCASQMTSTQILNLHEALERLARLDERKSRIVELRYFGGLDHDEVALVLGVSEITVKREWLKAKAWLYTSLNEDAHPRTIG